MPNQTVVVNATPIIVLSNIKRLNILRELYGSIVVPEAVAAEVSVKNPGFFAQHKWINVKPIENVMAYRAFTSVLHAGEVEVMILAEQLQADLVILDDGLARRHAKYIHLNLTGTIGVLLKAKQEGIIENLKNVLNELLEQGFYLSDQVYAEVLKLAGE